MLALIRDAFREHLKRLAIRELEQCDRKVYESRSQRDKELSDWEREASWPEEVARGDVRLYSVKSVL